MKFSRSAVHRKIHSVPPLRFEDQQLTSFSGLILFQLLFIRLQLLERLRRCFRHLTVGPIFGHAKIVLLLVVHMLLGYRELRDSRCYCDDPLVKRILGLQRRPDVATVSRSLAGCGFHTGHAATRTALRSGRRVSSTAGPHRSLSASERS